jgi:hypothetical protein
MKLRPFKWPKQVATIDLIDDNEDIYRTDSGAKSSLKEFPSYKSINTSHQVE